MNAEVREQKSMLRQRIRDSIRRVSTPARAIAAGEVCTRVRENVAWRDSECLLLYMPLPDEVDIRALARESLTLGKVVALPRFDPNNQVYVACQVVELSRDLETGRFRVQEPTAECPVIPSNRLDFVVVPGIAFTLSGRRLGRGKGYYDRLLATVSGTKCGVALDEQIVDSIPVETHDVQLDWIVTPTRSVRASGRTARF